MKHLLLAFLLLFTSQIFAQSGATLVYTFLDTLGEQTNQAPSLKKLGTGGFVTDTITCSGQIRKVYHFDDNQGLKFDNNLANNWFKKSYTIELYFKMEEMTSWKRVVDYKNRTTDWGCYVYSGKLNFFNIAYSDTIPFEAGKYQYYTVTRDSVTKQVRVYSSGSSRIDFIDNTDAAILSPDNLLTFFQDDLVVINEASPGNIALLRLTNKTLDSATVLSRFTNLCATLSNEPLEEKEDLVNLFPNPANHSFSIQMPVGETDIWVSMLGLNGELIRSWTDHQNLNIEGIKPGFYLVKLQTSKGVAIKKLMVE